MATLVNKGWIMIFDCAQTKHSFETFTLGYEASTTFDPKRPMGNVGRSSLIRIVEAWLVGLEHEIAPMLPRALEWIDYGIQTREDYGSCLPFHLSQLQMAKALATWMRDGKDDPPLWNEVVDLYLQIETTPKVYAIKDRRTLWLDDFMSCCIQAGRYDIAMEKYEFYHPGHAQKMQAAEKPSTPAPRDVGYALCLQAKDGRYDAATLDAAKRRMLRGHLQQKWLGRGGALTATLWLKSCHWDGRLTPLQTLLKAYEDMPDVQRCA